MSCSFKLNHYKEILEMAIMQGYTFCTFDNYREHSKKWKKIILLRHDIEFRPDRALNMAQIEASLDIPATYFVRVHSPEYNPFEFKTYKALCEIRDMRKPLFEIGLHYEAVDLSRITGEGVGNIFLREKGVLENIFHVDIDSAAPHGDFTGYDNGIFGADDMDRVEIENQVFEDRFFKDMKYISDSLGNWREGCACEWLGKYDRLHINTHPTFWHFEHYHTI